MILKTKKIIKASKIINFQNKKHKKQFIRNLKRFMEKFPEKNYTKKDCKIKKINLIKFQIQNWIK